MARVAKYYIFLEEFKEAQSIAEEAYIFGYPMILMDLTAKKMSNVPEAGPQTAPVNQFAHFTEFPTPDFKDIVKPNADTLYSLAWLNLSEEPLVLHVPDTDDRYYLMPMLDAYSNVFESPGKRTTGTGENNFAIVGPFWDGELPDGVTKIQSPTELVWILGRIQANGIDDFDAVNEIQKQFTMTPLSSFGKSYQPPQTVDTDSSIDMKMPPVTKIEQSSVNVYYDRMAMLMKTNPPASDDADLVAQFVKIGLIPGEKFDSSNLDPKIIDAIELGAKDGLEKIKSNIVNVGTNENGWQKAVNLGSYGTDYLLRASVAFMGLGANLPEDAIYPMAYVDSNGDALNGNSKYVIHFAKEQTPPVNAFWSLTMYNMAELFVENPIDLYAIGDRNELEYNEDGSLDIYIQHEAPEGHELNWLPSPDDDFNLTLRFYWPSPEIADGTWQIPSIQKVE
ncbi:MAG: DUF1254 domain-containing protein [Thaumarchaeota archaeon]|nr:DUF1254 domain-containing protein [Nitrososphaerota archaeon]